MTFYSAYRFRDLGRILELYPITSSDTPCRAPSNMSMHHVHAHGMSSIELAANGISAGSFLRDQVSQMVKVNDRRPRTVVITQGPDATIIASEGKVREIQHTPQPLISLSTQFPTHHTLLLRCGCWYPASPKLDSGCYSPSQSRPPPSARAVSAPSHQQSCQNRYVYSQM